MAEYVTAAEVAAYLRSSIDVDIAEIEDQIIPASNAIDHHCLRTFTVPTTATARTFVPKYTDLLIVDDIASTVDLTIADSDAAVDLTGIQLEIDYGVPGPIGSDGRLRPYMIMRRVSGSWSSSTAGRATVSVTARWGWPETPAEVALACKMIIKDSLSSRDTRFGFVQIGDFSRRIAENQMVLSLLEPLTRDQAMVA